MKLCRALTPRIAIGYCRRNANHTWRHDGAGENSCLDDLAGNRLLGRALHRYYIKTNAIPKDGEINPKGLDKVMQLLVEDGTLVQPLPKTDKYVDMSYLAEARRTLP